MELERYNIRLPKKLNSHIQAMTDTINGTYKNPSEFLCDLVRRHKEHWDNSEQKKWDDLRMQLSAGLNASEDEFYPVDIDDVIERAKKRRNIEE